MEAVFAKGDRVMWPTGATGTVVGILIAVKWDDRPNAIPWRYEPHELELLPLEPKTIRVRGAGKQHMTLIPRGRRATR